MGTAGRRTGKRKAAAREFWRIVRGTFADCFAGEGTAQARAEKLHRERREAAERRADGNARHESGREDRNADGHAADKRNRQTPCAVCADGRRNGTTAGLATVPDATAARRSDPSRGATRRNHPRAAGDGLPFDLQANDRRFTRAWAEIDNLPGHFDRVQQERKTT